MTGVFLVLGFIAVISVIYLLTTKPSEYRTPRCEVPGCQEERVAYQRTCRSHEMEREEYLVGRGRVTKMTDTKQARIHWLKQPWAPGLGLLGVVYPGWVDRNVHPDIPDQFFDLSLVYGQSNVRTVTRDDLKEMYPERSEPPPVIELPYTPPEDRLHSYYDHGSLDTSPAPDHSSSHDSHDSSGGGHGHD